MKIPQELQTALKNLTRASDAFNAKTTKGIRAIQGEISDLDKQVKACSKALEEVYKKLKESNVGR